MTRTSSAGRVYHGEDAARTALGLWADGDVFIVRTTGEKWVRTDGVWVEASSSFADGYIKLAEIAPVPETPAANGVRIYAVNNGKGRTQLMALFATGVAQQIAIQPEIVILPIEAGNPIGLLLALTYAGGV